MSKKRKQAEATTKEFDEFEFIKLGGSELQQVVPNNMRMEIIDINDLHFTNLPLREGVEERIEKHITFQNEYGVLLPPIVDDNGSILFGEDAVEAARRRNQTHIAVLRMSGLPKILQSKLRLFETEIARGGEPNRKNAQTLFCEILASEPDFNFELLGFSTTEIDLTFDFDQPGSDGQTDPADELDPLPGPLAVSRLGDIWVDDRHKIICGDAGCSIEKWSDSLLKNRC